MSDDKPSIRLRVDPIWWKCHRCDNGGPAYPREAYTPSEAVGILLFGCEKCDPGGEDCYTYVNDKGQHHLREIDGSVTWHDPPSTKGQS